MKAGKKAVRRPVVMYRNTDPTPMREFTNNLNFCKENETSDGAKEKHVEQVTVSSTISEETETNNDCIKKTILHDEQFLVSTIY